MLVWDNHTCLPLDPHDERFLPELEGVRRAGVSVVSINVGYDLTSIEQHVRMLAHLRRWFARRPDAYVLIGTADDVLAAQRTGRLGVFFDIEGGRAIDDQLSLIALYYDLGVRWMSIAYNLPNRLGGGCMTDDPGLTPFGAAAVEEMARVGMIACCSHTGERTALEVIEHSRNPVIFSHSNPRALWDHRRNISDMLIRTCAAKGGVVGINGVGLFLGENDTRSETIARNIDHVARIAGIDHVAIGLDYVYDHAELVAHVSARPEVFGADAARFVRHGCAFAAPAQLPAIGSCLEALGYAPGDIARVMGGNLLRIAQAVWKPPVGRTAG